MKLMNLKQLYEEMRAKQEPRQQFQIVYNGVIADTFFFIDQTPFVLAFGIIMTGAYFELQVQPGFNVTIPFSKKIYNMIIREFHIKYDPNHKYSPFDFLKAINKKIPQHITSTRPVEPRHIAKYRRDIEESNKVYFCGFANQKKYGRHVSQKNLHKTRTLMGEEAYRRCLHEGISTKWTDMEGADRYKHWKDINPKDYFDF